MSALVEWGMIEPGFHGGTLSDGEVYGVCSEKAGHAGFEKSGWYVYPPDDEPNPVGPFKTLNAAKKHVERKVKNAGT